MDPIFRGATQLSERCPQNIQKHQNDGYGWNAYKATKSNEHRDGYQVLRTHKYYSVLGNYGMKLWQKCHLYYL